MSWCLLNNLPGLRTLDILIMFIGCTSRSTGSSKHQGLVMNAFVTSFSTRASRSGGWIQLYSQESWMKSYSYVKSMLMISFFVQLTLLFAKNLEKWWLGNSRCPWSVSSISSLDFKSSNWRKDFHPSRKVYKWYSQEIQDGWLQADQDSNAN